MEMLEGMAKGFAIVAILAVVGVCFATLLRWALPKFSIDSIRPAFPHCPHCGARGEANSPGRYRCRACAGEFWLNERLEPASGMVSALRSRWLMLIVLLVLPLDFKEGAWIGLLYSISLIMDLGMFLFPKPFGDSPAPETVQTIQGR